MILYLLKSLDRCWKPAGERTLAEAEYSLLPFSQIKIQFFLETKAKVLAPPPAFEPCQGLRPSLPYYPSTHHPPWGENWLLAMAAPLLHPQPSAVHHQRASFTPDGLGGRSVTGSGALLPWLMPRISFNWSTWFSEFWDWEWSLEGYPFHLLQRHVSVFSQCWLAMSPALKLVRKSFPFFWTAWISTLSYHQGHSFYLSSYIFVILFQGECVWGGQVSSCRFSWPTWIEREDSLGVWWGAPNPEFIKIKMVCEIIWAYTIRTMCYSLCHRFSQPSSYLLYVHSLSYFIALLSILVRTWTRC